MDAVRQSVLPLAEDFLARTSTQGSIEEHAKFVVPYLRTLHRVVYKMLPKPNKGLWEKELGLDHFLLSYYTIMLQNYELQQQRQRLREGSEGENAASAEQAAVGAVDPNPTQMSRL